jgi:hypothetical protein
MTVHAMSSKTSTSGPNGRLEAVLAAAAKGRRFVPLWGVVNGRCECPDPECMHPGKHPRISTGKNHCNATSDPEKINLWAERFPNVNWAYAPGLSDEVVLDVDPRNGGTIESLNLVGPIPRTRAHKTGGDGIHYIFQAKGIGCPKSGIPGVDIKGGGGLVVWLGSLHASGHVYELLDDCDPAPLPQAWVDRLSKPKKPAPTSAEPGKNIREGARNTTLASFCGHQRRFGTPSDVIESLAFTFNEKRFDPPLSESEVRAVVQSILRYEAGRDEAEAQARRGPRRIEDIREEAEALADVPVIPCCVPGLVIPAGFAGAGKTSYLRAEAKQRTAAGQPVLYVSAELSGVELADGLKGVTGLHIVDDTPLTPAALVDEIERWVDSLGDAAEQPFVLVDFLQRFRAENRQGYRVVGEAAEALQRVTRKTGVITIAAAQLSRASQQDGGPKIHHLREAGELEQVADLVLLLSKIGDDRLLVEVGKNRWGRAGQQVEVSVDFASATFRALNSTDVYKPLALKIEAALQACGGRSPTRAICNGIRWGNAHPTKRDVLAAAQTGMFVVEGKEIRLPVA